jgi:serine/threonine-protein kinase
VVKGLGSAKVEEVGARPTRGVEATQIGDLDRMPASQHDVKSYVPMSLSDTGETESIGQYEVVGILGRGGMGVVYEVVDQSTGFIYALKTIETRFLVLPEGNAAQRFKQEISVLERLDHPSVVRLYDSGFARHPLGYDLAFFVMERLDGDTLDRDVKGGKIFTVEETLDTMAQLLDALDYLGQHGVLHRDIKPGNLFREVGGRVVLMDFGLARSEEFTRLTLAGQIVGTFGYMSPERLTGKAFDISSDVYALGVVFYQMLAGLHPFNAATPTETLEAIKRGLQFPPSFPSLDHGNELMRVIRWMLSYKAEDRPKPALLRDELGKLLGDPAMSRVKRGRITRKRTVAEKPVDPAPPAPQVLVSTKTIARPKSPAPKKEQEEVLLTTPNTPSAVTPIVNPPESRAPSPSVQHAMSPMMSSQPMSGMIAPSLLTTSGPSWASAGMLTVAAACVAFLAGLLVGRTQGEVSIAVPAQPVATAAPAVVITDKPKEAAHPASERPAVAVHDDATTTPASQFTDANAAFVYAELLIGQGKFRPAIDTLNRALELNPAYANAHRRLGDAFAGLGELDRAANHYKTYLALRPAAPDAAEVRRFLREMGS